MKMHLHGFRISDDHVRELLADEMMGPYVEHVAAEIAATATAQAPVRSGRYRRSLGASDAAVEDGDTGPIMRAYAYSTDPFAHLIEFGSAKNPAYRPLTGAALAHSARFVDPGPR